MIQQERKRKTDTKFNFNAEQTQKVLRQLCVMFCVSLAILIVPFFILAVSDTTGIDLKAETGISYLCNQNGICEPARGETEENCFTDCGCNYNGICEPERMEDYKNCLSDCPAPGAVILPDTTLPVIYNLLISKITINSAEILWETNKLALCQVFWGKTPEYEKESISETTFYLEHSTKLTNLASETTYHFKIVCKDTNRNESETKDQKFSTLAPPDITPPANVLNFEAIPGDSRITLKWQNPPDPDFKAVRIMRGEKFYPINPREGVFIYEGREQSFIDTGLINGVRYYYTVFAYDYAGNFSSGATVSVVPRKPLPPEVPLPLPEEIFIEEECQEVGFYWYDDTCHLELKIVSPPPEVEKLTLEDFDFWQKGEKLPIIEGNKIKLKEKESLTASIDYEKVPEVLKTIMVTLKRENKYFSFLLRVNQEKTNYLATLVPPEPGIYPFTIYVLDFENQILKAISGELEIEKTELEKPAISIPWYKNFKIWLYILIAAIGIAIITYIFRRK